MHALPATRDPARVVCSAEQTEHDDGEYGSTGGGTASVLSGERLASRGLSVSGGLGGQAGAAGLWAGCWLAGGRVISLSAQRFRGSKQAASERVRRQPAAERKTHTARQALALHTYSTTTRPSLHLALVHLSASPALSSPFSLSLPSAPSRTASRSIAPLRRPSNLGCFRA